MSKATQRYVRNVRTGVIFGYTPELGRHRHCASLSLDLCAEYERRQAVGPEAVRAMEQRLMQAEQDGEALSAAELAEALKTDEVKATPVVVAGVQIPDDFDLDVDLGPLGKLELQALGERIGFPLLPSLKVAAMRQALREVLDAAKAERQAVAPAVAPDDVDDTDDTDV